MTIVQPDTRRIHEHVVTSQRFAHLQDLIQLRQEGSKERGSDEEEEDAENLSKLRLW